MLLRINKLKNFGIYREFAWQASIPDFAQFNLIYGWNYSGKTTLSRAFRCLELGHIHNIEPVEEAEFEFLGTDTTLYNHEFASKVIVRVFNQDFIKENLQWDTDNDIQPIVLLGEGNIELQGKLAIAKINLDSMEQSLLNGVKSRATEQERINLALTNKAREVANALHLQNFNRTHFLSMLGGISGSHQDYILTKEGFREHQIKATSIEQKPPISFNLPQVMNLSKLRAEVDEILKKQCLSGSKIEKLLSDANLSQWVEAGKALHHEKDECGFCGGSLPVNLITELNNHFSKDYEDLKHAIELCHARVSSSIINLISHMPSRTNFYVDLQEEYGQCKVKLERNVLEFNNAVQLMLDEVSNKKNKPFDVLELADFFDNQELVEECLGELIAIIDKNDKRTVDFEAEKLFANRRVKAAYAAEFEVEEGYSSIVTKLATDQQIIDNLKKAIKDKRTEIKDIEVELVDTVKGAEQVNTYLSKYFSKGDILIEANELSQFKLMRGSQPAKNLSEGEKTAIGFAYFMASLQHNGNALADTIVCLDDPISSLDSNHLFNTYAFIKDQFYNFRHDLTGAEKHECLCKQLFISTHNYELLNLVKDWFGDMKDVKYSCYSIEREQVGGSKIKAMPKLVYSFKSEYAYLFSIIHSFRTNPSDEFVHLYNLPNIIRRFIETFSAFKFLSTKNIDQNLDQFIMDSIARERVRKFVHYNSHNLDTSRMLQLPNFAECIDIATIVLSSLETVDESHYQALCDSAVKSYTSAA